MKTFIAVPLLFTAGLLFLFKKPKHGINNIQVIGSHNSYKEYIDTPLFLMIKKEDSNVVKTIEYSHSSLSNQLNLGLRSLEIDVYADTHGGRYAHPGGLAWAGKNPLRPYDPDGLMREPGFKVLHVQDIDFRSNCLTLKRCFQELRTWSDAHPGHEPVFITVNAKDDTINKPVFTRPEKFTPALLDGLDTVIAETLGLDKLISPALVRGKYASLEQGVLHNNWPKLNEARNKFVFVLDEEGAKRAAYIKGHTSLEGRNMFVNSPAGTDEAAIIIINDPVKNLSTIQQLVKKGYIVRTRADADTREARTNDKTRFDAACRSGAQIISTDYYAKSQFFKSDYIVSFDKGRYVRANPVVH